MRNALWTAAQKRKPDDKTGEGDAAGSDTRYEITDSEYYHCVYVGITEYYHSMYMCIIYCVYTDSTTTMYTWVLELLLCIRGYCGMHLSSNREECCSFQDLCSIIEFPRFKIVYMGN